MTATENESNRERGPQSTAQQHSAQETPRRQGCTEQDRATPVSRVQNHPIASGRWHVPSSTARPAAQANGFPHPGNAHPRSLSSASLGSCPPPFRRSHPARNYTLPPVHHRRHTSPILPCLSQRPIHVNKHRAPVRTTSLQPRQRPPLRPTRRRIGLPFPTPQSASRQTEPDPPPASPPPSSPPAAAHSPAPASTHDAHAPC